LIEQEVKDKYDFNRPGSRKDVVVVETLRGIRTVFDDFKRFKVTYTENMKVCNNLLGEMVSYLYFFST
jgi:hypothetical protein